VARAVPIAVGVVVLIAGSLQLTAWKARHLACCREARLNVIKLRKLERRDDAN
jgi:predicted metal-binding membrane protein